MDTSSGRARAGSRTDSPRRFTLDEPAAIAEHFGQYGYAVVGQVFDAEEVAQLKSAADRAKQRGLEVGRSYRHGNQGYWIDNDAKVGVHVLGAQWPSYDEPDLELLRRDPRMLALLQPLIGSNIRQIVNQLHWKTPGSSFAVSFHRDRVNRKPPEAYRALASSYVQTATAIDPMTGENGRNTCAPSWASGPNSIVCSSPAISVRRNPKLLSTRAFVLIWE